MTNNTINSWSELQNALDNGGIPEYEGGSELVNVVRLTSDITAPSGSSALNYEYSHELVLDLNGHKINRNLDSQETKGSVIRITGGETLTIRDSSSKGTGVITGGNSRFGGGIYIISGSLVLESGSIKGNQSYNGGGVYLDTGASFTQKGGTITDNTASFYGGGVFADGNQYTATSSAKVTGNKDPYGNPSNVFLQRDQVITVDDGLSKNARIGISVYDNDPVTVTSGFAAVHDDIGLYDVFSSDDKDYCLHLNSSNEGEITKDGHTALDPEWTWNDDYSEATVTVKCSTCGEVFVSVTTGDIEGPSYDADLNKVVFTASAAIKGTVVTGTAEVDPQPARTEIKEPSINDNGKYVPGNIAYYKLVIGDKTYYFNETDGHPGSIISADDIKLSYLLFDEVTITGYTGNDNSIALPSISDTDNNLTALGGNVAFFINPDPDTSYSITDRGSITTVNAASFGGINGLTLTLTGTDIEILGSFENCGDVMVWCNHSSGLAYGEHPDQGYTVDYLDDHLFTADMSKTTWAADYSSADVCLVCSLCGKEITVNTTDISITPNEDGTTLKITAATDYGNAVLESAPAYVITLAGGEAEPTLVPRSYINGAYANTASYDLSKLAAVLTAPNEFSVPAGFKNNDIIYKADETVTLSSNIEYSVIWDTDWTAVNEALANTPAGESIDITLYGDMKPSKTDTYIYVPEGVTAVIDLNGFTIDRGLETAIDEGYVFKVDGSLTLKNGTVTGGNNTGNGGAAYVAGYLFISEMKLNKNTALNGGGIYLEEGPEATSTVGPEGASGGSADMYCGEITENDALERGGGVYVSVGSSFRITTILSDIVPTRLRGSRGSGTGGSGGSGTEPTAIIENNTAGVEGGGVYINNGGTTFYNGAPQVVNNSSGNLPRGRRFDNIHPQNGSSAAQIGTMVVIGAGTTSKAIMGFSVAQIAAFGGFLSLLAILGVGYLVYKIYDTDSEAEVPDQREECQHYPRRIDEWTWYDPDDYTVCDAVLVCPVCGNTVQRRFGLMGGEEQVVRTVDPETQETVYTAVAVDPEERVYSDEKRQAPYVITLVDEQSGNTKIDYIAHQNEPQADAVYYDLAIPDSFKVDVDPHFIATEWVDEEGQKYPLARPGLKITHDKVFTLKYTQGHVITYDAGAKDATGNMTIGVVKDGESYTLAEVCGYKRRLYTFKNWYVMAEGIAGDEKEPGEKIEGIKVDYTVLTLWQSKWSNLGNTLKLNKVTELGLEEDMIATAEDSSLIIPGERTDPITLDLKGYTINRNNSSAVSGGNIFIVNNDFTLTGGRLTGSKNQSGEGGAIVVNDSGKLTLNNITITGNSSSENLGGGLYVHSHCTVNIKGKVVINNNSGGNVYLADGAVLNVTGDLAEDSSIHVTMQTPGVFTNGLSQHNGSASNFVSDDDRYKVQINDQGEAYLSLKVDYDKGDEGASGTIPSEYVIPGSEVVLPECTFGVPEGKKFKEWSVRIGNADPVSKAELDTITVTDNTTVTAVWEDLPDYAMITSATVSFDEQLKLNYYIDIPENMREGAYAILTCGNGTEKINVSDAPYFDTADLKGFKFSYTLLAQQIEDVVNIRIYDKNGSVMKFMNESGSRDYTDTGVDYTILSYVDYMISYGSETMKVLAQAGKDYCYSAKKHFVGGECPVSPAVDAVTYEDLSDYVSKRSGTMPAGVSIESISASFGSDNSFRLYLDFTDVDPDSLTYKLDGEATTLKKMGNMRYLTFKGIVSTKLDEEHTFTISDGVNTYDLTVCVLTYARAVIGQSQTDTMVTLAKALYLYNKAADAHFKAD